MIRDGLAFKECCARAIKYPSSRMMLLFVSSSGAIMNSCLVATPYSVKACLNARKSLGAADRCHASRMFRNTIRD